MSKVFSTGRHVLLSLFVFSSVSFSQTKTLTRIYEPVIANAETLTPLFMTPIANYTAYAYNATADSFTPIPFQIDEVNRQGRFLVETDGFADSSDQVAFMPESAGDRAPKDKWIATTQSDKRIELAVTNNAGQTGWIYLFSNVSPVPTVNGLVTYDRGSLTALADTVFGKSYTAVHDPATGWYTDMRVAAPFGNAKDLVDRRKIRIAGSISIFPITLTEDVVTFASIRQIAGPVRVLRELTGSVTIGNDTFTLPIVTQYFPYSNVFSLEDVPVPNVSGFTIREIRQTLDLNENAIGMSFYNPQYTGGLLINGTGGTKNDAINVGLNWYMVTGDPGTVLVLMGVPPLGDQKKLYYKDNSSVDQTDTGDKKSYGDAGWSVQSTTTITGTLGFDLTTYFFGKVEASQTSATGEQFKNNALNSYQVTAEEQERTSTGVADNRNQPASFVLDDAQPNPFWQQRGSVRLSFSIPQSITSPSLRVYNLIGQEVARFDFKGVQSAGSKHQVQWDGRAANGQMLPAGIYFYQLQAGTQVATKKLIIIR